MSKVRSPCAVCSTTIGISGLIIDPLLPSQDGLVGACTLATLGLALPRSCAHARPPATRASSLAATAPGYCGGCLGCLRLRQKPRPPTPATIAAEIFAQPQRRPEVDRSPRLNTAPPPLCRCDASRPQAATGALPSLTVPLARSP